MRFGLEGGFKAKWIIGKDGTTFRGGVYKKSLTATSARAVRNSPLSEFAAVLEAAMGWLGGHVHAFDAGGVFYNSRR